MSSIKHDRPRILGTIATLQSALKGFSKVEPDGMVLVAMHASFALFKIDGVRWQVPMHQAVAIGVKIESFLTDGRGGENKGAKWRIKGLSYGVCSLRSSFFSTLLSKARCKTPSHCEAPVLVNFTICAGFRESASIMASASAGTASSGA